MRDVVVTGALVLLAAASPRDRAFIAAADDFWIKGTASELGAWEVPKSAGLPVTS
ncbi:MAG: hypothetical protein M0011_03805 [Elusimicrobia bacterium]|nr:hypothetical protein [Elusimicrobiota bacterium]